MKNLLKQKMLTSFNTEDRSIFDNVAIRSPIRFPGSKFQAIKFINLFLNASEHDEYREPFFGGGAVFFAKPKVRFNWINDLSNDLIVTFNVIADKNKRKKLIDKLNNEDTPTKDRHQIMKGWSPSDEIDIAYKYYY